MTATTEKFDETFMKLLESELRYVEERVRDIEHQRTILDMQVCEAHEYRRRLEHLAVVARGGSHELNPVEIVSIDSITDDDPSRRRVLREQALRARLAKTDMSAEHRIATLQEASRKFGLSREQVDELATLRAATSKSKRKTRKPTDG